MYESILKISKRKEDKLHHLNRIIVSNCFFKFFAFQSRDILYFSPQKYAVVLFCHLSTLHLSTLCADFVAMSWVRKGHLKPLLFGWSLGIFWRVFPLLSLYELYLVVNFKTALSNISFHTSELVYIAFIHQTIFGFTMVSSQPRLNWKCWVFGFEVLSLFYKFHCSTLKNSF